MTTVSNSDEWENRCLAAMRTAVSLLSERTPLLGEMAEYHLGWGNESFGDQRSRGKMFRPLIAIYASAAIVGEDEARRALPLAAAIELLHNFTLIHDDIQDNSPTRRHRPTVWAKWGAAQAINAGDALFAAAHIALLDSTSVGVSADLVLELLRGFDATTIEIVSGQVLDLHFENRQDVSADEYIEMIAGKTARIVEFAAGGGAWVAGADNTVAGLMAQFGLALGLGFQVQDDLLGTFGSASETGKAAADDIRRKKQSLPVLYLRQRATLPDLDRLNSIYGQSEIGAEGVALVLDMMNHYGIESRVRETVAMYHDRALDSLRATSLPTDRLAPLLGLVTRLESRIT